MRFDELARGEGLVRTVALAASAIGAAYLAWRIGWTVNYGALWLAVPLLVAEAHGYFTFLGYFFITWDCRALEAPPPLQGASVDFFIPTYSEPLAVLAPTVAAAAAVKYPHRTYVLDDGRREWVRRLCRRLRVRYLTRPTNEGAKAGNLNHALAHTASEFVAIVDADFVPGPDFIDEMLGYFRDPAVAFVQAPQEFYNRDSFQHLAGDKEAWHEQALFFRTIQPGKNRWNAAFWCGCPSILRRAALESVGGVATETVTEDLHTSIRLHAAGWKSVFHPRVVALGVAPNDYDGFILQRLRWAEGTMQVIRRAWRSGGLTLAQRINYIASTGTYFDALRKAVFLSIVPLVLFTDQLPIRASMAVLVPVWTAQFVSGIAANNLLGRGNNRHLITEFFDSMKMFAFIRASLTLISGKRVQFRVTPKGQPAGRTLHRLLAPFVALVVLYCVALGVGVARLSGFGLDTRNTAAQVVAIVWGLAILAFLSSVTLYGYRKVSQRRADRVTLAVAATYRRKHGRRQYPVVLGDLTTMGAAFRALTPPPLGAELRVHVRSAAVSFRATVRRLKEERSGCLVGLAVDASEATQTKLARLVAESLFPREPPLIAGPVVAAQRSAA